tara:strand:+ start:1281 stop:1535 length:255 start_codon:yes stop_codon:yes gene_type:complete
LSVGIYFVILLEIKIKNMEKNTMKIKAFNNAEIISLNIMGELKETDNISLSKKEFDLLYTTVIKTVRQLEKNDLLKHSAETILN